MSKHIQRTVICHSNFLIFHQKELLNWDIRDINFHIDYLNKQRYRINFELAKTNIPVNNYIQQFYKFSDTKFKKIVSKENSRLKNKFSKISASFNLSLVDKSDIENGLII